MDQHIEKHQIPPINDINDVSDVELGVITPPLTSPSSQTSQTAIITSLPQNIAQNETSTVETPMVLSKRTRAWNGMIYTGAKVVDGLDWLGSWVAWAVGADQGDFQYELNAAERIEAEQAEKHVGEPNN